MKFFLWSLRHPLVTLGALVAKITGTEWGERPGAWPHCCGQDSCWAHYGANTRWCRCECRWCRLARYVRPKSAPREPAR